MKIFLEFENNNALRTAMLRKSRPWRGPYEVGQKVVYWRLKNPLNGEGGHPGYRQGIILALDPGPTGSVWLRNDRGRVVQVAREQLRCLQGEEAWIPGDEDFALLRSTEMDLSRKHAGQHDLRALPSTPATPTLPPIPETPAVPPESLQGQPDVPPERPRITPDSEQPEVVNDMVPGEDDLTRPLDVTGNPINEPNATVMPAPPLVLSMPTPGASEIAA